MASTKHLVGKDIFWVEAGHKMTEDEFTWKEKLDKKTDRKFYVNQKTHDKKWVLPGSEKKDKKEKSKDKDSKDKEKSKEKKEKKEKGEGSESKEKKEKKDKKGKGEEGSEPKEKKEKKDKKEKDSSADGDPKSKEKKEKKDKKEKDPASPETKEKKEKKEKSEKEGDSKSKDKKEKKSKEGSDSSPGTKEKKDKSDTSEKDKKGKKDKKEKDPASPEPKDKKEKKEKVTAEDGSPEKDKKEKSSKEKRDKKDKKHEKESSSAYSGFSVPDAPAFSGFSVPKDFSPKSFNDDEDTSVAPTALAMGTGSPAAVADASPTSKSPKGPARPLSSFLPSDTAVESNSVQGQSEVEPIVELVDTAPAAVPSYTDDYDDDEAAPTGAVRLSDSYRASQERHDGPLAALMPPRPSTPPSFDLAPARGGPLAAATTIPKSPPPVTVAPSSQFDDFEFETVTASATAAAAPELPPGIPTPPEKQLENVMAQSYSIPVVPDIVPQATETVPPPPSTLKQKSSSPPPAPVFASPLEPLEAPTSAAATSPAKTGDLQPNTVDDDDFAFEDAYFSSPKPQTTELPGVSKPNSAPQKAPSTLPPKAPVKTVPSNHAAPIANSLKNVGQLDHATPLVPSTKGPGRSSSVASSNGTKQSTPAGLRTTPDSVYGHSRGPTPPGETKQQQQDEGGWETNSMATPSVQSIAPPGARSGSQGQDISGGRNRSSSMNSYATSHAAPQTAGGLNRAGGGAPTTQFAEDPVGATQNDDRYHDLSIAEVHDLKEELARAKRAGLVGGGEKGQKKMSSIVLSVDDEPEELTSQQRKAAIEEEAAKRRLVSFQVQDYDDKQSINTADPMHNASDLQGRAAPHPSDRHGAPSTQMYGTGTQQYGPGSKGGTAVGGGGGGYAGSDVGSYATTTNTHKTLPASLALISDVELQDEFADFCAAYDQAAKDRNPDDIDDTPIHPGKIEALEVLHHASQLGYEQPQAVPMEDMTQLRLQQLQGRAVPRAAMSNRLMELQRHEIDAAMNDEERRYRQRLVDQMSVLDEKKKQLRKQLDECKVPVEEFSKTSRTQLERQRHMATYHQREVGKTFEVVWEYFLTKLDQGEANVGLIESVAF